MDLEDPCRLAGAPPDSTAPHAPSPQPYSHPGLHLTATHTGGTNDSNLPWPMPQPFDNLTLGLVMYQAYDKIGSTIGLNIDEVAVDAQRIGCSC